MHNSQLIVGLTGTHSAGKGTVVEYLKQHGFIHFSAREFILKSVRRRGLPEHRLSIGYVANKLREVNGPDYIVYQLLLEALRGSKPAVIESIYTMGEICKVRYWVDPRKFVLVAVDADVELRYKRAMERKSSTDHVTFAEFVANEQLESSSNDPAKHNLKACRDAADMVFLNNGTVEELHRQLDESLRPRFLP